MGWIQAVKEQRGELIYHTPEIERKELFHYFLFSAPFWFFAFVVLYEVPRILGFLAKSGIEGDALMLFFCIIGILVFASICTPIILSPKFLPDRFMIYSNGITLPIHIILEASIYTPPEVSIGKFVYYTQIDEYKIINDDMCMIYLCNGDSHIFKDKRKKPIIALKEYFVEKNIREVS